MSRTTIFRSVQVAVDVAVLSLALWAAFYLRFDWDVPPEMFGWLLITWPYVVALQFILLAAMGVPRFAWRYVGLKETTRILAATSLACALLVLGRILGGHFVHGDGFARYTYLPLGVIAIDFPLAFMGIVGVRAARRISSERAEVRRLRTQDTEVVPTLIVGAGRGGVMVAKEVAGRPELGILPVGFIDDDVLKHGSVIHGLRVLGRTADIRRIARQKGAKQAIIAIANAPGSTVRGISVACKNAGLQVKIIPGLYQLVGGELNLTRMRDVAIEDLLRREAVDLDDQAIAKDLSGSVVLVTGAGGSIGSEICRQVSRFGPRLLILVERAENALFAIHRELLAEFPGLAVEPMLADISDKARLDEIFTAYRPEVVFHAAAHKHVPMMEWNPGEAVKNNVFGSKMLADAAHAAKVRAFVMISTDKAVNPTSVMGATKRVAELYIQALARTSSTRFVTVRFGNVLGSNGSVVPIFKEQIARGGPITVTHPDMRRYFMTIPEACQLVLQAGAMGSGGEIFILDMGEPVKIVDLARDLIQLSGFDPDEIEVVFTGTRPGEKLYEELAIVDENAEKTRHPKIFIGRTRAVSVDALAGTLSELGESVKRRDANSVREALRLAVPEYSPSGSGPVLDDATHSAKLPREVESEPAPHPAHLRAVT